MDPVLLLGLVLAQSTWTVDDDGGSGVDFDDLPAAVAAAADGDALLVRPGTYAHFTLSGKGLRIIGQGRVLVVESGTTTQIAGVPAGSELLLQGLEFPGPQQCAETRLSISGAQTRVTLIDVTAVGHINNCNAFSSALRVSASEVLLVRATLTGGGGFSPLPSSGGPGGSALHATDGARVFVVESALLGGAGTPGHSSAGDGGPGLHAEAESRVWLGDSTSAGGYGSAALSGDTGLGGAGVLATSSARVRVSGGPGARITGGPALLEGGPGVLASGGARVVVHAVGVWKGRADFGDPEAPQTVGFVAAQGLPSLHVEDRLVPTKEVVLTLSSESPVRRSSCGWTLARVFPPACRSRASSASSRSLPTGAIR